jgi:glycosyltransferase involved in cell wall biosynthesis
MSVIVPVRNAQDHIAMCLRAIQQSSVLPAELLVMDDGSQDGSADVAERLGARVLRLPKSRGPAAARNAGADAARQPVLMFLDADVLVHPDTIEHVDAALSSDSASGAVFGAYDDAPLSPGLVSQYRNLLHHFTHCTARRDAWTFWAGCGAIRRDLFLASGGFDEQYAEPSIEDIELGLRLTRAGVRIRVAPQIQVCHMKKWTLWGMLRTDVLLRAWPWSRLLLRSGCLPADLNLDWRQRASALLAWLCVGLVAAGFIRGITSLGGISAGFGAILAAAALALFNRPFFRFLIRARGIVFALRAFPLYILYLLYSSATFTVAAVVHFLQSMHAQPLARNTRGPEAGT